MARNVQQPCQCLRAVKANTPTPRRCYKRALAIKEKALGQDHPSVAATLGNLANVYRAQGKYDDAESLSKRALAIYEKTFGADHPDVASTLNNLAVGYRDQGKYADAEELYKRALAIKEKALGPNHPDVAMALNNLAILFAGSGNSEDALDYSRKAAAAVIAHAATETTGAQRTGVAGGLVEQRTNYFVRHVANLAAVAQKRLDPQAELGREAFVMGQWAKQSAAAAAIEQMGLRFAAGSDALAALLRQRQDLSAFWRERDKALVRRCPSRKTQSDGDDRRVAQSRWPRPRASSLPTPRGLSGSSRTMRRWRAPRPLKAEEVQQLLGARRGAVFWLPGKKKAMSLR